VIWHRVSEPGDEWTVYQCGRWEIEKLDMHRRPGYTAKGYLWMLTYRDGGEGIYRTLRDAKEAAERLLGEGQ
jgi:hypothetical protein